MFENKYLLFEGLLGRYYCVDCWSKKIYEACYVSDTGFMIKDYVTETIGSGTHSWLRDIKINWAHVKRIPSTKKLVNILYEY